MPTVRFACERLPPELGVALGAALDAVEHAADDDGVAVLGVAVALERDVPGLQHVQLRGQLHHAQVVAVGRRERRERGRGLGSEAARQIRGHIIRQTRGLA